MQYLITIASYNKLGLMSRLINVLNSRLVNTESISAAKTDNKDIVWISIEIDTHPSVIQTLKKQLEKIIGVMQVEMTNLIETTSQRMAMIKVSSNILNSNQAQYIRKYDVQMAHIAKDILVLYKTGSDDELKHIYNSFKGEHLLSYCQSGLLSGSPMNNIDLNNFLI